jgi:signal transduction histidine kinase
MLHGFIAANRHAILARTRERVAQRSWPSVSTHELENGVPLFLTQLSETLRLEASESPFPTGAIRSAAGRHGEELSHAGFTVAQVVQDYGDICEAITEVALEQQVPITVEEFRTLHRSVDNAISGAVTEHTRLLVESRSADEVERLGHAAHELRDILNTALLAFHTLKRGTVSITGDAGAILGRSLMNLQDTIYRTLSEVRLAAGNQRQERVPVGALLDEAGATGALHSEYRHIGFVVEPVDPSLTIEVDPQLVMSAVMNLLHNAFKYTRTGGHVHLRAYAHEERVRIEVEDECGGMPEHKTELFRPFGDRRATDRSGLGLGLSIARKAITAHGGDIHVRNMPGKGCAFVIELPTVAQHAPAQECARGAGAPGAP